MMPNKSDQDISGFRFEGRTLFLFVLITFVLWLSLRLSMPAELDLSAELDYSIPKGYSLHQGTTDTISLKVSGKIISLLFLDKNPKISIVLGKAKSAIVTRSELISAARSRIGSDLDIKDIHPSKVIVKLDTVSVKVVPIITKHNLILAEGFSLLGEVKSNPGTVEISGFLEDLKSINSWNTEVLQIENLRADHKEEVNLVVPNSELIHLGIQKTETSILVDQYIEKELIVPFQQASINNYDVIPKEIKVNVTIPMRYYEEFTSDDIGIEIDSLKSTNTNKSIRLAILPSYINVLNIYPDSVRVFFRDKEDLD